MCGSIPICSKRTTICVLNIALLFFDFSKGFIAQKVYKVCTRTNYKIVPVISLNKYLHFGTVGNK
jgi:hypothetical protein